MSPSSPSVPPSPSPSPGGGEEAWLDRFHEGDRATLEGCYRRYFPTVERAARAILGPDDAETVVHDVFARLVGTADLRRSFRGGAFGAWIATVARNLAIDYRRRLGREVSTGGTPPDDETAPPSGGWQEATEARMLIERFRREHLDPKWAGVFELRFLHQLPQRDAAKRLGINRTTLAYREVLIRRALKRFLLEEDEPESKGNEP